MDNETPDVRYRALSRLAVLSVALGALSILSALSWFFGIFPAVGIVLALLARRRIRQTPEELSGLGLAWLGLALCVGLWGVGAGCLALARYREIPHGYTPVSFEDLRPDPEVEGEVLPPAMLELEGKKVFIKGYMYPGRQSTGIKRFILVPTLGHCAFCTRSLRSTEMVYVTLVGDLTARFKSTLTHVGGTLRIDSAQAYNPYGGLPYQIEADHVK